MNRGRFVVLVGPDGVGKTTLARRLIADHGPPTMYLHFRPSLLQRPPAAPGAGNTPPPKRVETGPTVVGWVRLARSIVSFWLGYLRWIGPAVRGGALVVGDRWAYGYVGQPHALGFAGPAFIARFATRIVPRPDLVVRLRAPAQVVATRKADLSVAEIEREDRAWKTLPVATWELDAGLEVSSLAEMIATRLNNGV